MRPVKAALDVLRYEVPTPDHYPFVLLMDGKMATRKGASANYIIAAKDDNEIVGYAYSNISSKYTYDNVLAFLNGSPINAVNE